jgi:CCR4-NOT transcriptional regulation complex NOT5 subunit
MKKEIKKLQRVREYFRTNLNNSDIKDKTKL